MLNYRKTSSFHLVLIVIITLFTAGVIFYFIFLKTDKKIETITDPPITSKYKRVYIKDIYTLVSDKAKESIERTLYEHIEKTKPDLFTGVVRPRTYTKETTSSRQDIVNLLVDVEPVELTYKVTLISYHDTFSVNIQCAPQEQQMIPSNECKDILHNL